MKNSKKWTNAFKFSLPRLPNICRWRLNFGQSAFKASFWHFWLFDVLLEKEQIGHCDLLRATRVHEAHTSSEHFGIDVVIPTNQSCSIQFIIIVITGNNDRCLCYGHIIITMVDDIFRTSIQLANIIFNQLMFTFWLNPKFRAIFDLEWTKKMKIKVTSFQFRFQIKTYVCNKADNLFCCCAWHTNVS